MTVGEWLRGRFPAPPDALFTRIEQDLGALAHMDISNATEVCLQSAERVLGQLLARSSTGRESALDLLAVDALVTYAFEAASQDPTTLTAIAEDSLMRLAAVARV